MFLRRKIEKRGNPFGDSDVKAYICHMKDLAGLLIKHGYKPSINSIKIKDYENRTDNAGS